MSGWEKIFPDKHIVTLILDPFEAGELLDQALGEGRRIGERTIMGMPMIAFGDEASETDPNEADEDLAAWNRLGGKRVPAEPAAPEPETPDAARPDDKIAILPVVRREPMTDPGPDPRPAPAEPEPRKIRTARPPVDSWTPFKAKGAPLPSNEANRPAAKAKAPKTLPKAPASPGTVPRQRDRISPADRALIDEAIAAGRVTICPPCKHSVEPGELLPGEGWQKGKRKGRR